MACDGFRGRAAAVDGTRGRASERSLFRIPGTWLTLGFLRGRVCRRHVVPYLVPDCPRLLSLDFTTPQSDLHLFYQNILPPKEYALHLSVCTCLHLHPPYLSPAVS